MENAIYPATFCISIAIIKVYEVFRAKERPALILWAAPILALCITLVNYLISYRSNIADNGLIENAGTFIISTLLLTVCYLIPLAAMLLWDKYKRKTKSQ